MAVKPVTPVEATACPLCVPPFPPVYGTLELTPLAAVPDVRVPVCVDVPQLKVVIVPTGTVTVRVNVHVFPPIFNAKLAVPLALGVPVIVYVRFPAPLAKVPAVKVAVNPVTPVEVTVCPLLVPPFPPVYGTELLTPLAAVPAVNVPAFVAVPQLNVAIVPTGKFTVLVKVHVFPPIFNAKLAVPLEAGVPVIVYVKFPAPLTKVPAVKVAVKPVTPVEVTVCPLCIPPFPPV